MFGEFYEAGKRKTSLAKYSVELNGTNASAPNTVFECVRQTLHVYVCENVCTQTRFNRYTTTHTLLQLISRDTTRNL